MIEKDWTRKLFKEKKIHKILGLKKTKHLFLHAVNGVVSRSPQSLCSH